MATNKERTSSAAMRKLLLQSASKKEQEIQQIGSVAESTIPQPAIEHPIHEEVKESAPVKETVQEPQPEQMEKPESKPSVQSSPKTEESKVCGKKFSEYLEERKLKNTEVIRISSETHRKLKQIAMATGLGMHNIANACSTASVGQALFLHTVLVKAGIEPGHFYTTAEKSLCLLSWTIC